MDGKTRLWAMRRSKWDGADGGLCSRRVCAEGTYEGNGQRVYRRSGVWDGKAWVRNIGGLCSRRVWVGDAPDGEGGAAANGERRVQRLLDIFANCKRYVRHLT